MVLVQSEHGPVILEVHTNIYDQPDPVYSQKQQALDANITSLKTRRQTGHHRNKDLHQAVQIVNLMTWFVGSIPIADLVTTNGSETVSAATTFTCPLLVGHTINVLPGGTQGGIHLSKEAVLLSGNVTLGGCVFREDSRDCKLSDNFIKTNKWSQHRAPCYQHLNYPRRNYPWLSSFTSSISVNNSNCHDNHGSECRGVYVYHSYILARHVRRYLKDGITVVEDIETTLVNVFNLRKHLLTRHTAQVRPFVLRKHLLTRHTAQVRPFVLRKHLLTRHTAQVRPFVLRKHLLTRHTAQSCVVIGIVQET
ncbi:hypothetical protein Pcinc_017123 [Petrolisthes cinctipes]|uniref:Uncharacterized protein n=1 Tax=Petrolisthes cinctipes TaxID=88211 RepID=A0AAE1FPR7_PETCI|nr:hypothetical protein Pcinc_017123 [Petrolisthes cinctipes]